jgi:hypothetical protein
MCKRKLQPTHPHQSTITKIIVPLSLITIKRSGVIGTMIIARAASGFQTDGSKNTVNGIMTIVGNTTEVFSLLS